MEFPLKIEQNFFLVLFSFYWLSLRRALLLSLLVFLQVKYFLLFFNWFLLFWHEKRTGDFLLSSLFIWVWVIFVLVFFSLLGFQALVSVEFLVLFRVWGRWAEFRGETGLLLFSYIVIYIYACPKLIKNILIAKYIINETNAIYN